MGFSDGRWSGGFDTTPNGFYTGHNNGTDEHENQRAIDSIEITHQSLISGKQLIDRLRSAFIDGKQISGHIAGAP